MENIRSYINSLDPSLIGKLVLVSMILFIILLVILFNHIMKSEQIKKSYQGIVDKNRESFIKNMRGSRLKAFNYDELNNYICRTGLSYMTNEKLTPISYMFLKIAFAFFFMIVGLQDSLILGIILLPVGYFGLDLIASESNKADNTNMLEDIKNVYDTLRIQTKAGVYITSVITDCYLVVQNKRLKKAFLRLTSDMAAKNDANEALDNFKNKFTNEYIDTLVIIIKQSMQTGQAAKMFEDIRNQITDIEAAMVMHEKIRIQTKITFVQLMLYSAIIIVAIFIAVTSLSKGLQI